MGKGKNRILNCYATKKYGLAILIMIGVSFGSLCADTHIDSLYKAIETHHGIPGIEARLQLAYELRKADFKEAYYQNNKAFEEAGSIGDIDMQGMAMHYLGLTLYYHDRSDSAVVYFNRAIELYRSNGNYEQLAKVLCALGSSYLSVTGDQNQAITHYNEALIYARKSEDHKTMAVAYSQLSNIFRMNGAYQQAIEFIYKSKEQYEMLGFDEGVAWILYSIGRIYNTMSLFDEAHRKFSEGLKKYQQLPESISSLTGVAICYDELALTCLEKGNISCARTNNEEARKIYRQIGSEFGLSNAFKYKARIEYQAGNSDLALSYLDRSRKIKKNINDILGFPGVYELYGSIFWDEHQYQDAIDSLNVGLRYAKNNNQKNRVIGINEKLAYIYAELNDFGNAYIYRTVQTTVNDSIYQSKSTRAMTQLEALYDLEVRENIISELERQNLLTKSRLEREVTVRNFLLIILTMSIVFVFFMLKLLSSNRSANETLKKNQKQLQELNATKDKFTSIIAHDLKSPFNSLIGFSSLLGRYCEAKDYDKVREFSSHINDVSTRTFKLLENLLAWSRSQTGKISFDSKALDIKIPIKNAVDLMESVAKKKNIEILVNASTIAVMADENMLHTILQNLLSNAIKYSYRGGKIHLLVKEKDNHMELCVKDEGVGMDEGTRSKLFTLDKTVTLPGTNGETGTGLGLILCKEFVERHRGHIDVKSEPGKGSCFTIYLPL